MPKNAPKRRCMTLQRRAEGIKKPYKGQKKPRPKMHHAPFLRLSEEARAPHKKNPRSLFESLRRRIDVKGHLLSTRRVHASELRKGPVEGARGHCGGSTAQEQISLESTSRTKPKSPRSPARRTTGLTSKLTRKTPPPSSPELYSGIPNSARSHI